MTQSLQSAPLAEIIAIGDELASGQRLDTNSQWLSQQLGDIGIRVHFHTTVVDELQEIEEAIRLARDRSEIVITSGGLGPTADDLTRQAIANVARVPLELHEPSWQHIQHLFASRNRTMTANNRVQAMLPAGANVIFNELGTAPGIDMVLDTQQASCRLFALPGVPYELKLMWEEYVVQHLREQFTGLGTIVHHAIHCFGAGESEIQSRLPDLIKSGQLPAVGITASKATITLRISAHGQTPEACRNLLVPVMQQIEDELGDLIFGENDTTLQEVVIGQLLQRDQTLAVVDMGGCSLISQWLDDADPDNRIYAGTISLAEPLDFDSAVDMARQTFETDILLVLGPSFEHDSHAKREVMIAAGDNVVRHRFPVAGHPSLVIERSVKQALNLLRLSIERGKI